MFHPPEMNWVGYRILSPKWITTHYCVTCVFCFQPLQVLFSLNPASRVTAQVPLTPTPTFSPPPPPPPEPPALPWRLFRTAYTAALMRGTGTAHYRRPWLSLRLDLLTPLAHQIITTREAGESLVKTWYSIQKKRIERAKMLRNGMHSPNVES